MPDIIKLPDIPKDYLYEDYIAAYLQASGIYIERSLIHKEIDEIMELDIVASDIHNDTVEKCLIEIKSGKWGYPDLFKVKGWMSFLGIQYGAFVAQKTDRNMEYCIQIAKEMNITFIDNSDLHATSQALFPLIHKEPEYNVVNWIRYAYALERAMLKRIKELKTSRPEIISYRYLDNFFQAVNSRSFFRSDPLQRIHRLFQSYLTYKNLSAKMAKELETGIYDENCNSIPISSFRRTLLDAENNAIHISLYVEHLARLTILKSCIDYLIVQKSKDHKINFAEHIQLMLLPRTIKKGLEEISSEPYFHRYPVLWQIFTYVLGGIILEDYKEDDYKILGDLSGIPIEHIDNAFEAFNKLFPKENGWFQKYKTSNIKRHRLFPIPFHGIGVNYRRCEYTKEHTFDKLDKITGLKTMADVIKWNGLAFDVTKTMLPVTHVEE